MKSFFTACQDDVNPFLMYGDYCLASSNGVFEYNKIHGACSPSKPTIYTEETKEYVINAAKNYFLGGGIFLYYRRNGPMQVFLIMLPLPLCVYMSACKYAYIYMYVCMYNSIKNTKFH